MEDVEQWLDRWEDYQFPALEYIYSRNYQKDKLVDSIIENEKSLCIEGIKNKLGSEKTEVLLEEFKVRMEKPREISLMSPLIERYLSVLLSIEKNRRKNLRLWCELVGKCLVIRAQAIASKDSKELEKPELFNRTVDLCKGEPAGNITVTIEPSMEHSLPHIRIKSKKLNQLYHPHEIGFCYLKSPDKINQLFATLGKFAFYKGTISTTEHDKITEKSVSRLRKHLSVLLGIKKPIDYFKKRIGYRSNIKIEDKSYLQETYHEIIKDAPRTDALDLVDDNVRF